jgi:hypothetical protein
MTPNKHFRRMNVDECKRYALAARSRCNVKYEAVACALHVHVSQAEKMFGHSGVYYSLSYADLFLLARAPETASMVREMLAPLLEIVDRQSLRLSDLDGMASTSTTAQTALEILRPTVERLESLTVQHRTDTREVVG